MSVIIDVTNDDSQGVSAADWWTATVPDDHRNVIFFALFSVERFQTGHNAGTITVVTAAWKHDRYTVSRKNKDKMSQLCLKATCIIYWAYLGVIYVDFSNYKHHRNQP